MLLALARCAKVRAVVTEIRCYIATAFDLR